MTFLRLFWNFDEHRLRALWRILIQGGLFLLFTAILTLLLGIATSLNAPQSGAGTSVIAFLTGSQLGLTLTGIFTLASMLLTYLIASRLLDRRPLAEFGFHFNRKWWQLFVFGLFLGAFLMCFIFLIELACGWVTVSGWLTASNPWGFFLNICLALIFFICVGFYEEMLARGYQLRNLAEGFNWPWFKPKTAVLIGYVLSSIIFGFLHADNPNASAVSTINLFAAGLFLGLGYILTGELALSIGLHITWNFFEGNVFGFPVSGTFAGSSILLIQQKGPVAWTGGPFGPEAGIIGIITLALGSLLIFLGVMWITHRSGLESRLAIYKARSTQSQSPTMLDTRA